jgi:hypothetical protein
MYRLTVSRASGCLLLWKFDRCTLVSFALSSTANRKDWSGITGSFLSVSASRHASCAYVALLVEVWVILDRPPNDPLLRKEEPFTSSYVQAEGSKEAVNFQQ